MDLILKNIKPNIPFIELVNSFLNGTNLTVILSNKIYNNLYLENLDYIKDIDNIKDIINKSNKTVRDNIFFIKTKSKITDKEIVLLIRFINICYKNKYFIIVNNNLVYIPEKITNIYSDIDINNYINIKIREYKNKIFKEVINKYYNKKFKSKILAKIVSLYSYNIKVVKEIYTY